MKLFLFFTWVRIIEPDQELTIVDLGVVLVEDGSLTVTDVEVPGGFGGEPGDDSSLNGIRQALVEVDGSDAGLGASLEGSLEVIVQADDGRSGCLEGVEMIEPPGEMRVVGGLVEEDVEGTRGFDDTPESPIQVRDRMRE